MSDSNIKSTGDNISESEKELEDLRRLLIRPEQEEIAQILERMDIPDIRAEEVSRVLAEAIVIRAKRDDRLALALLPTVEKVIRDSVKKDPKFLADAIFPIMGPAIRKAISEAIQAMMQSFNEAVQHTFTLQGMKWRIESIRTGRPFAEIVLLHTLIYQVEQVFLIHKETGLVLLHAASGQENIQDTGMVSGMLTAIQDFVNDSFSAEGTQALQSLNVGELTIWIEQGSKSVLAAVIRGNPPQELRSVLQKALESIEFEQNEALYAFQGDSSSFESSRHHLVACLVKAQRDKKEKKTEKTSQKQPVKTKKKEKDKEKKTGLDLKWLLVAVGVVCMLLIVAGIILS